MNFRIYERKILSCFPCCRLVWSLSATFAAITGANRYPCVWFFAVSILAVLLATALWTFLEAGYSVRTLAVLVHIVSIILLTIWAYVHNFCCDIWKVFGFDEDPPVETRNPSTHYSFSYMSFIACFHVRFEPCTLYFMCVLILEIYHLYFYVYK